MPAQRQQLILKTPEQQEVASIAELADSLGVSHMAVRRDIQCLEQGGSSFP